MSIYTIPLQPALNQVFGVTLNRIAYRFRLVYSDGWVLDIEDSSAVPIVTGIPLIPNVDLLHQYTYLFYPNNFLLYVKLDTPALTRPGWEDLGIQSHLLVEF
jgi:hypothetical protein